MERLSFLHIEHAASRHAFALGGLVAVRSREAGDLGQMTLDALVERLQQEVAYA